MKPQDETPSMSSGGQSPALQTSQTPYGSPKVKIHEQCQYDPTRKEEQFAMALMDFLQSQKSASLFRVIICPKRAEYRCCWVIDPVTGEVFCDPCENVKI